MKKKEDKVVSAYSKEGKARSKKAVGPLSSGFKALIIILYVVVFVAAIAFIFMAESLGWF